MAPSASARTHNYERIALCLAGNVRTFTQRHVHTLIWSNLLHPLSIRATVDVFASFALDDDTEVIRSPGGALNDPVAAEGAEAGRAFAVLQPRVLQLSMQGGTPTRGVNRRCVLGSMRRSV